MLRTKLIKNVYVCKGSLSLSRTFFSHDFKSVLDERLEAAVGVSACAKQTVNDASLFINRLTSHEVNRRNVCEQITKLRSSTEGTNAFQLANHLIIKRFVETGRHNDLTDIFKNRLYYRIFLDVYTGCYLIDHLLKIEEYPAAAKIALQLIVQENFDDELLILLSMKSFYGYTQTLLSSDTLPSSTAEEETETPEKKTRLKYLRNSPINFIAMNDLTNSSIGKAILMTADKDNCPRSIQKSLNLLGVVLCEKYEKSQNIIMSDSAELHTDVLALCAALIKDKNEASLLDAIKELQASSKQLESFNSELDRIIKETCRKSEPTLIKNQSKKYITWAEESKNDVLEELKIQQRDLWHSNVENDLAELYTKSKKLHFFELEDQIELEIFHKKKLYPKKWFGKKKKPKVVDDDYVPPEIVKRVA